MRCQGQLAQREATRIAIVDDDAAVLRSLDRLLRVHGFQPKTYASASALLGEVAALRPSCIISDLCLPGISGLGLQQSLADAGLPFPLVFITAHGDLRSSVAAMRRGAVDFLEKPFRAEELLEAIGRAVERDRSARAAAAIHAAYDARASTLTPRERDVLAAVLDGLRNKQIAASLGIAEKTVKIHRARIMSKMEVRSVAQLARVTERFGIPTVQ